MADTYDQQGYIIGDGTHYVQLGVVKLTISHAPKLNETPKFVGSEDGLDMLCCEHCHEEIGQVVWDGSAFCCRCGARYQAKLQRQPTVAPRLSQGSEDVLTRLAPLVQGLLGTRTARLHTIEAACLCDDLGEAGKTVAKEIRALFNQHDVPAVNLAALVRLLAPYIVAETPGHSAHEVTARLLVVGVPQADHVKSPKRGDMWRTDDGKVCLVVDSAGYSSEWDCRVVTFWRDGVHDTCEADDFGLLLTSLNVAFVERPATGGA